MLHSLGEQLTKSDLDLAWILLAGYMECVQPARHSYICSFRQCTLGRRVLTGVSKNIAGLTKFEVPIQSGYLVPESMGGVASNLSQIDGSGLIAFD